MPSCLPTVTLIPAREKSLFQGHPWIFPKAIESMSATPETGELVQVVGQKGEFLAVGVYNAHSLYRVRVLAQAGEECASLRAIVEQKLLNASRLRTSLQLPSPATTAYREFNSEGDGLSGLVIDRFGDVVVVAAFAFWVQKYRSLIEECIREVLKPASLIWKPQQKPLAQDGWDGDIDTSASGQARVMEEGVLFDVDFSDAQKTGLFLDQRENHLRIGALARGKRVLDLYTYSGGFALHAARNGAASVTAIDSSAPAIAKARANAENNGITSIEFIEDDARNWLARAGDFDLIILDPPKLVPSRRHLEKARNYYRYLHREVFRAMKPGSLLMTCNCSSAMDIRAFEELVSLQASHVGRQARIHGIFGPAACHPTLAFFPEGQYLGAILLSV